MHDLERVMGEAWGRVAPWLLRDRDELRARLARRRSRMFLRPPRAFCVAVRASDRRITPWNAVVTPEHAMDFRCAAHLGRGIEHQVVLDARLLRELCAPVEIPWPGVIAQEAARRLGMSVSGLVCLRRNGMLKESGRTARVGMNTKVPLLYSEGWLDPAACGKRTPDPIWGSLWPLAAQRLPEDLAMAVRRWPDFSGFGGVRQGGWRWICPGCGRRKRTIYYPLAWPDWSAYLNLKLEEDEVDAVPQPVGTFACKECHGVVCFSRENLRKAWHDLILHFSGGLLYGREVERPGWLGKGSPRSARRTRREG